MLEQLTLFGIFLFIIVQTAALPAFIMWMTPFCWTDFLCEQEAVVLLTGNSSGLFSGYTQCCCAEPPCESDVWPAEGAVSPRMDSCACCWPLFHLQRAMQRLKWGWTFHFLIASKQKKLQPEWIKLINASTVYDIYCFISNNLDTLIITPALELAAHDLLTGPDNPDSHQFSS